MPKAATILVVGSQAGSVTALGKVLQEAGFYVVRAARKARAVERSIQADVVVLDTTVDDGESLSICRELKNAARASRRAFLPVLVLLEQSSAAARVRALRAGAEDVLGKPFDREELCARVEALLRTQRLVSDLKKSSVASEDEKLHDPMTGLYNQEYLLSRLDEEFARAHRYNEPLSVVAVDIDQLEDVNSRYGRGVGDRLLTDCAQQIVESCRSADIVTRAGGDEFVALLPNTHFAGSLPIAERIWRDVRSVSVIIEAGKVRCSATLGVSCFPGPDVKNPAQLLRHAHLALARAKAEGGGQICLVQHQGYLFQPH